MTHINKNSLKKFLLYYIPVHILLYYIVIIAPEHLGKYFIAGILSITGPLVSTVILFFTVRKREVLKKFYGDCYFSGQFSIF